MPGDPDVKAAQEALRAVGINLVDRYDGVWSARTAHAVREFHIYARGKVIGRLKPVTPVSGRYVDRIEPIQNPLPYTGAIHGELDGLTLSLLLQWADPANAYCCPLVVEARIGGTGATEPLVVPTLVNVWTYDDPAIGAALTIAHSLKLSLEFRIADFSTGAASIAWDDMPSAGKIVRKDYAGGLTEPPVFADPDMEMIPSTFVGKEWSALGPLNQRLFRIIRAVAEQECSAFFDSLNGWDNAVASLGPCQWTLALPVAKKKKKGFVVGGGELPAYMAFAIGRSNDIQSNFLSPFGVAVAGEWKSGKSGAAFSGGWKSARNYTGYLKWRKAVTATSSDWFNIDSYDDIQWFRTTHWFWRLLTLCRSSYDFRAAQWDMVRTRLRDLLSKTLQDDQFTKFNGLKIGDIFTSDLALAFLLRCHIRYSAFAQAGISIKFPTIGRALQLSGLDATPAQWGDAQEQRLIEGMLAAIIRYTYRSELNLGKVEPTREQLLKVGAAKKKYSKSIPKNELRAALHADLEALREWPDPVVFKIRGFRLEQAAKVALGSKRDKNLTIYNTLVADGSLPPPPV